MEGLGEPSAASGGYVAVLHPTGSSVTPISLQPLIRTHSVPQTLSSRSTVMEPLRWLLTLILGFGSDRKKAGLFPSRPVQREKLLSSVYLNSVESFVSLSGREGAHVALKGDSSRDGHPRAAT